MALDPQKIRTTVVLSKTLKDRAFELSERTGAPFSAIVRIALEKHLGVEAECQPETEAA